MIAGLVKSHETGVLGGCSLLKSLSSSLSISTFYGVIMIDFYSFGKIKVAGRDYSSDIIIYPDGRVQDTWWRQQGHRLASSDIKALIAAEPEVIVVGTGSVGLMQPAGGLVDLLVEMGVELIALKSGKAVQVFNRLVEKKKVGACFHLTC